MDRNIVVLHDLIKCTVALRKESVDRNSSVARTITAGQVALRKESVDRNTSEKLYSDDGVGRSPQGERG